LEATSSRIEITKILAELFTKSSSREIDKTVYLLLGSLAPSYRGIVFNLAERMMLRIIAKAYGENPEEVSRLYKQKGDLGIVASELARGKGKNLSVSEVYDNLVGIAQEQGKDSQERKNDAMANLMQNLDPLSARFVARIPVGRLRLGFSDKTILDALSWMQVGDKSKKGLLEKAYQVVPDVGLLAKRVKEVGIDKATHNIKPILGIPVLPMLPQRIKSPTEMIAKMGKVFVEPKFDGLRVLIHYNSGKVKAREEGWVKGVKAFTRNLNNVVGMFSELSEVGKHVKAKEVIFDTEAIGMDPELKKMANFQTTMQRRRKHEIETKSKEIPLRFQVFDIVYKDGKSLMDKPYWERREVLKRVIKDDKLLIVDEAVVTEDPQVINREYQERVKLGLEGVVVKKYDTPYIPGRTGWRWVKMKQVEAALGKLADTVDCVVMGYTRGRGKRASFGIGQFLVGVMDKGVIKTVTKVGTGLTDDQFRELNERLGKIVTKDKPREYGDVSKILLPDFWVKPFLVVEIAADEITKSPNHSSGLALRFPRLVKFRDDKSPKEATTVSEVKKLFDLQTS
jgi:DNA ligase-1